MAISEKLVKINEEVVAQEDLLAQIVTALEGKAGGGGGIDTSDANATSADMREDTSGYVNGVKIDGAVPTRSEDNVTFTEEGKVKVQAGIYDVEVLKDIPKNTEIWIFTLENGSTVEKEIEVGA